MKKATIILITTFFLFHSCSKINSSLTPRAGITPSMLTDKWWTRDDGNGTDNFRFNSNGQYLYLKDIDSTITLTDSSQSFVGSWNWTTNDTIIVTASANLAYTGKHLITELSSDSLNITFHIGNQTGLNSYSKSWHRK